MKQAILYIALTFAGMCLVVTTYFSHYYYALYQTASTDQKSQLEQFDMRLATLEAHKSRELTPVHLAGILSTTDQLADEYSLRVYPPQNYPTNYFETSRSKGGLAIEPELRIPAGATNSFEFDIHIGREFGTVTHAWLSSTRPFQDLATFQQFDVAFSRGTNVIRLTVQLKPGATVKRQFEFVVLCLK